MLLRHYLEQGVSKSALARKLGISRDTIYRWIRSGELERDALSPNSWDTQREAVRVCSRRNSAGDFIPSAECGATSL